MGTKEREKSSDENWVRHQGSGEIGYIEGRTVVCNDTNTRLGPLRDR